MKVVLLTDVKSQGKKNDVIEVSDGYARNYLIPRKLAVEADSSVLNADGRLYGSITSKEIAERLEKDHGISVDKRKIQLSDPIRAYGQYDLDVKLYTNVAGKIHVLVCN